ncbi:MAG: adenosylmethionine--8-amino-7-oxononanoate transaminase [Proteobacteria bacterium]|nr:adenosylmethionine--8-amino-7-oxononanoate transaminase [Pseudomonadota bacterium]MBU1715489.1 adenosylmethionine--8-amino-7-oxononanoate transaminase [Pseudomonadota bacterium]
MNLSDLEKLLALDAEHVWHPYAAAPAVVAPYLVESASGTRLKLADGRELIDGMSSWWAAIHGYNHPVLNQAVTDQLASMAHVMFGGLTHEPAILLAKKLVDLTPDRLTRVFFCDSGSVSVEVAIKMAIQYWLSLGQAAKNKLLTIRHGYHGDTFGAMSVCDPVAGMHHLFGDLVNGQFFVEAPAPSGGNERQLVEMERMLAENNGRIAVVILEPMVQGAGGMRFYPPDFLKKVRVLCDQYQVLLIADEIATGFGRTGRMFACEHAAVTPDIMCVGKALTGGYLSFAATMTTEEVCRTISTKGPKMLMHGPTYMANPLACSVALASLGLLAQFPLARRIGEIELLLRQGLEKCRELAPVKDVRVLGAIGVIETHAPVDQQKIQECVMAQGVWLRPFNNLIYTMPPFIISDQEIVMITEAINFSLS